MKVSLGLSLTLLLVITTGITGVAQDGIVVPKPVVKPASVPRKRTARKARSTPANFSRRTVVVTTPVVVAPPKVTLTAAQAGAAGLELFNKKEYAAAETSLRQALALDPKNTLHNYYLGAALMWQLKHAEAEVYLRKAVALDPGNVTLRRDLANDLYLQQKYPQAEEELRTAVGLEPRVAAYHVQLGNLLYHVQKYSESEKSFLEAVRLEPGSVVYQKALAVVQAAMKTPPKSGSNDAALHNNMGNALFEQHKYAEAEKEFREALRLYPNNVEYINNLAKTLAARQKLAEADAHAAAVTSTVESSTQKNTWMVFTIENRTPGNLFYNLNFAGTSRQFVLQSQHKTLHTEPYQESVIVAFDHKYEAGEQNKYYPIGVTKVTGHEPTDSDKRNARVWAFMLDKNGDIVFQPVP